MKKAGLCPTSERRNRLTPEQSAAMKAVDGLAAVVLRDYPQVATDYRSGLNQKRIALKYGLEAKMGIRVARMAIGVALKQLIPAEERRRLARFRIAEAGRQNGLESCRKKIGIYSVTPNQHSQRSSRAGRATRDAETGIFKLSAEQRIESARHANRCRTIEEKRRTIRKLLATQGKIPWITDLVDPESQMNEPDYMLYLVELPEYIIQTGPRNGCHDCVKIAAKLNQVFHQGMDIRTPAAVGRHLVRIKS